MILFFIHSLVFSEMFLYYQEEMALNWFEIDEHTFLNYCLTPSLAYPYEVYYESFVI